MTVTNGDFFYDTSTWNVKKENGEIVPFDEIKLYNKIVQIAQIAIEKNNQLSEDISPDKFARIAMIQICASIQNKIDEECSGIEIPTCAIRNITEQKLAEMKFLVAKAYIIEHALHLIKKSYDSN